MNLLSDLDKVFVAKATEAGQGHIFDGWKDLSSEAQQSLIADVEAIDFQLLRRLIHEHLSGSESPLPTRVLKPAPLTPFPDPARDPKDYEFSRNLAEYALRTGEVLIVTAAGGKSPFAEPTGKLPIGPASRRTIFQLFAERIGALNRRYRTTIRWHIFCHPSEAEETKEHFKENNFFGLKRSSIAFVPQTLLPLVDRRGRILLSGPGKLAKGPSGHGGVLLQLLSDEVLAELEGSGVRYVFYHQVDNPLAQVGDPTFLGLHVKEGSEVSSKCVLKNDPDEPVGVFCQHNESAAVIEYTELAPEDRRARHPDGRLVFSAANVGIHIFSVEFLRRLRQENVQLPFHAVPCSTPCLNRHGDLVEPSSPNAIGFRAFVFDAIPFARRAVVTEVPREEEFSPVKRPASRPASGEAGGPEAPEPGTLERARLDLSRRSARWLRAAGFEVPEAFAEPPGRWVELSPLYALDAEELKRKGVQDFPAAGDIQIGGGS
ncbi:MAG: UTP--glucose-1-phosphate uridylyltransferase [Planctomycetota bacterium]